MARVPHWLGIGVAAVVVAAGAAFFLMDKAPDAPGPEASNAVSTPPDASAAIPKAVATPDQPAMVTLQAPTGRTRSLGQSEALQITVRPEGVRAGESYLVNVYAVPKSEQAQAGPEASKLQAFVGSFSFFPPPREGEVRTFTLPPPEASALTGPDVTLKVEIVPAGPDTKLETAKLAIIEAKIGTP